MNLRGKPEFGFAIRVRYVHMDTRLFAGEEEKTKLAITKYGWCHLFTLHHVAIIHG
jgi:hypothetical protein